MMRWFVSCDNEWEHSQEFETKKDARAWMLNHFHGRDPEVPGLVAGDGTFRVWRYEGAASVKVEESIELKCPKPTMKDV